VEKLRHSYRVTALDLHGYGNGPEWTDGMAFSLHPEVELLTELVAELDGPIHLVGHSYGAAVAIKAAQTHGRRISSLTLYKPVIFTPLFAASAQRAASAEVIRLTEKIQADYRSGGLFRAAQRFIDYWSGSGAWNAIPAEEKLYLSRKVPVVLGDFEEVVAQPNALAGLASLQIPTLYLSGRESPASIKAISKLLERELPNAARQGSDTLSHIGPITHSEIVNASIERFIDHRATMKHSGEHALAA